MYLQPLTSAAKTEWKFRQAGTQDWQSIVVPGDVHTTLLAAGKIPDPFVGDNELKVQWVAEKDWEFKTTFDLPASGAASPHLFLTCDGLDTLAEVTLNGKLLGKTDNEFRQYRFDVSGVAHAGKNELSVFFPSTVAFITEKQKQRALPQGGPAIQGANYVRKAPCQFGWDWGPMLPPIGIWKDIRLEGYAHAYLEDVHLRQKHTKTRATVSVEVKAHSYDSAALKAVLQVTAPSGKVYEAECELKAGSGVASVAINNPKLWWPNGYGEQPLYGVEVTLIAGSEAQESKNYKLGLRTLELQRLPDQWGESFTFVVNGVKIFAKGSDWIPADSFPSELTTEHMEHLIRSAAAAHQNMLRIWGGGYYEEERFYDLCDQYGILLWQDMMFACGVYPLNDPAFLENVRIEIEQNIRRLRHRASLALWCGNNEMEEGWEYWGWSKPEFSDLKEAYDTFFHHTLPEWIARDDTDLPYWPSSPSSNTPFKDSNSNDKGDAHYWDVWHGRKPFTAYRQVYPRFMSEFGFQSLPPIETVATYAEKKDWNMTSYIMEHHQRSGSGNGLMIGQMADTFRMPDDFESLVYLSMMLQAEGIRYGVEHWRRNNNRVSGILYWQLNDCWPVASWASLDYYGRWKALHYEARRFYAPVLLSVEDQGSKMGVHVTNDLLQLWSGSVKWTLMSLGGEVVKSGEHTAEVGAQSAVAVCSMDFQAEVFGSVSRSHEMVFVAELFDASGKRVSYSASIFVPNKHLDLVEPELTVKVAKTGKLLSFAVSAKSLARFVELKIEGVDVIFSDNYFDVPGGWTVEVTCPVPEGWSVAQVRKALRARSLFNSYE